MLSTGNKTFMNLQEAVGWLLENNALPFQSTANYVGNTEIAMSTLINPSPAKVRVGSLIFFADSKVSTVVGVTSNSFIVSDQYNDLVDDVVYVSNVAINASGHLIVTLSNGDTIDAGLIKQVSSFSIDASQHLIATYNDGSTTDLGAIFSGNVNIAGNFTANSIIENMAGYAFIKQNISTYSLDYVGVVKNGNKITFAIAGTVLITEATDRKDIGYFTVPAEVGSKVIPSSLNGWADIRNISAFNAYNTSKIIPIGCGHATPNTFAIQAYLDNLSNNVTYYFRYEVTFLLSDSLVS